MLLDHGMVPGYAHITRQDDVVSVLAPDGEAAAHDRVSGRAGIVLLQEGHRTRSLRRAQSVVTVYHALLSCEL